MTYSARAALLSLMLLLASCAHGAIRGAVPEDAKPLFVAKVWVQPDPQLPVSVILEGCRTWRTLGTDCVAVANEGEADIRILADRKPCKPAPPPPKGDGLITLALAHADRHIDLLVNCFTADDGKPDTQKMRMVVAHEIGHELGIWDHVPLGCAEKDMKYVALPSGGKLCGVAVMNPQYDKDVDRLTDMDGEAFQLRDRSHSVYPASDGLPSSPSGDVICTYGQRR